MTPKKILQRISAALKSMNIPEGDVTVESGSNLSEITVRKLDGKIVVKHTTQEIFYRAEPEKIRHFWGGGLSMSQVTEDVKKWVTNLVPKAVKKTKKKTKKKAVKKK